MSDPKFTPEFIAQQRKLMTDSRSSAFTDHFARRAISLNYPAALDEIERLTAERDANRWIPVTERYPKGGQTILCYCVGAGVVVASLIGRDFYMEGPIMDVYKSVTHWRPMPEPPQDGA